MASGKGQHVIPASHIGSFSDSDNSSKRKRVVWVRRDGSKCPLKAESVGVHNNIYTIHSDILDKRYVDDTWKYVEDHLPNTVRELELHNKAHSHFFNATLWSTVLVPFVAQLFVRGVDFSRNLITRAPFLEEFNYSDEQHGLSDNTNMNRLIDYQINCGLLINAKWRLFHNQTDTPFILNDLGYATINGQRYGESMGYIIPLTKTLMLMIFSRGHIADQINLYGFKESLKVMLPHHIISSPQQINSLNYRLAICSDSEIYGPTEESVEKAWKKRISSRKESAVGPSYIQLRQYRDAELLDAYGGFLDLLDLPDETRKGAFGGRMIHVIEETRGNRIYALGYKDL